MHDIVIGLLINKIEFNLSLIAVELIPILDINISLSNGIEIILRYRFYCWDQFICNAL